MKSVVTFCHHGVMFNQRCDLCLGIKPPPPAVPPEHIQKYMNESIEKEERSKMVYEPGQRPNMPRCSHDVPFNQVCEECNKATKGDFSFQRPFKKCNEELRNAMPPPGPMVVPGYQELARVLTDAFDQSARGKGKERHANNRPFTDQPIMQIVRMVGTGGHAYQIMKKTQEAQSMVERGEHDRAIHEMRGAIVYAAAMILAIEELKNDGK